MMTVWPLPGDARIPPDLPPGLAVCPECFLPMVMGENEMVCVGCGGTDWFARTEARP